MLSHGGSVIPNVFASFRSANENWWGKWIEKPH